MTLLAKRMVEKPWGKDILPAPFVAPEGKRIGEVWFEPPAECPDILVKYIFTSEKLSVQVHPSDEQAEKLGETDGGKEECWLVIAAEPGAKLGIGFQKDISPELLRQAALDGSIEHLMVWYPVSPGDFFYIPTGTVHAIGAGVSLVEVQQNSNITYRLYDFGRPRELHLDKGIAVASAKLYDSGFHRQVGGDGIQNSFNGEFFSVHFVNGNIETRQVSLKPGNFFVIPLIGSTIVDGVIVAPGDVYFIKSPDVIGYSVSELCLIVEVNARDKVVGR